MRPRNFVKEEAIRAVALQIIADEGLENLTMQKLAAEAGVSPRTIYIKYENKEDLLVKLYIEEVLGTYEKAVQENIHPGMDFAEGVKKIWLNSFNYLSTNRHAFALILYGKSSPLLNRAYQQKNITEGSYFKIVRQLFEHNKATGLIKSFPHDVYRAMVFSPLLDLVAEYFDYQARPRQIITKRILSECCKAVIEGMLT